MATEVNSGVITPEVNHSIEQYLDEQFSSIYRLLEKLQDPSRPSFRYRAKQGFEQNGALVRSLQTLLSDYQNETNETFAPLVVVAESVSKLPELDDFEGLKAPVKLWRDALIHRWLKEHPIHNLEAALDFNAQHWSVQLLGYLQSRRAHFQQQKKTVGLLFTATYGEYSEGQSIDHVRDYLNARPAFFLLAWIHDFYCWLYDYQGLLQFMEDRLVLDAFSKSLEESEKEILGEVTPRTMRALVSQLDGETEQILAIFSAAISELLNDITDKTGFVYVKNTIKTVIDRYADHILRRYHQLGEFNRANALQAKFEQFDREWQYLNNPLFQEALLQYCTKLERHASPVTKIRVTEGWTVENVKAAYSSALYRVQGQNILWSDFDSAPETARQYVTNLREKKVEEVLQSQETFLQIIHDWDEKTASLDATMNALIDNIISCLSRVDSASDPLTTLANDLRSTYRSVVQIPMRGGLEQFLSSCAVSRRNELQVKAKDYYDAGLLLIKSYFSIRQLKVDIYEQIRIFKAHINQNDKNELIKLFQLNPGLNLHNNYHAVTSSIARLLDNFDFMGAAEEQRYSPTVINFVRQTVLQGGAEYPSVIEQVCQEIINREISVFDHEVFEEDCDVLNTYLSLAFVALQKPEQPHDSTDIIGFVQTLQTKYLPTDDEELTAAGKFLKDNRCLVITTALGQWASQCTEKTDTGKAMLRAYAEVKNGIKEVPAVNEQVQANAHRRFLTLATAYCEEVRHIDSEGYQEARLMLQRQFSRQIDKSLNRRQKQLYEISAHRDAVSVRAYVSQGKEAQATPQLGMIERFSRIMGIQ